MSSRGCGISPKKKSMSFEDIEGYDGKYTFFGFFFKEMPNNFIFHKTNHDH